MVRMELLCHSQAALGWGWGEKRTTQEQRALQGRQGWAQSNCLGATFSPPTLSNSQRPDVALVPTWGSSARTRSLLTGAKMFILSAALRGSSGRRRGLIRPGSGDPWGPDDDPRPRGTDNHPGPGRACGIPRPLRRYNHRGPRG